MNLQVLTPSRKAPKTGDVFVLQVVDGRYFHGCVIDDSASVWSDGNSLVAVAIFDRVAHDKPFPTNPDPTLLVPPLITNRLPWSRGYFETVGHAPLLPHEIPEHCFDNLRGSYFDAHGRLLDRPRGVIAMRAVWSFYTIDHAISLALGIEPSPDTLPTPPTRKPR